MNAQVHNQATETETSACPDAVNPHTSLAQSSVLVRLHIGIPTLKRMHRKASAEIADMKRAKRSRLAVYTDLIQCRELDEMRKLMNEIRGFVDAKTVAWDDGVKWMPNEHLIEVCNYVDDRFADLNNLRDQMRSIYPAEVAKAQLELGDAFDESQYPSVEKFISMFHWSFNIEPLPTSNDFRLQTEQRVIEDLRTQYDRVMDERIKAATQSVWERLIKPLSNMSERLSDKDEEGNRRAFHDTLVRNVLDIVDIMKSCNVSNDPEMDRVRTELRAVLQGVTADQLKSSDPLRRHTKQEIDKIIKSLPNFGF